MNGNDTVKSNTKPLHWFTSNLDSLYVKTIDVKLQALER